MLSASLSRSLKRPRTADTAGGMAQEVEAPMHRRIYPLAPLVLLALVAVLAAPASAAQLGKPAARKAAVKTMNRYLASHGWAKAGRVGKCQRKAPRRVVCRITLSGPSRACRTSAAVTLRRKARARLGRLRCAKPAPQQGSRMMRLAAHIGTPKRHLDNPFAVTYPYSASATEQVAARGGETEEPVPPPKGVLALYIDGVLECAMNTEGVVAGDECPHVYGKLGQHRVTAIYTAGSESAVDTTLHNVDPLPTEIALSVTYEPLAVAESTFGCRDGGECHQDEGLREGVKGIKVGSLTVTAKVEPIGAAAVSVCPPADWLCARVALPPSGTITLPVEVMADFTSLYEGPLGIGEALSIENSEIRNVSVGDALDAGAERLPEGACYVQFSSGIRPGYLPSEARAVIQFTPELGSGIKRVP